MKVIEEDAAVARETKKLKTTKLLSRINEGIKNEKDYSIDLERQLRKLATRGVVALFNAISKSKRDMTIKNQQEKSEKEKENESHEAQTDNFNADRQKSRNLASSGKSNWVEESSKKEKEKEWRVFDDELMTSQKGNSTKNKSWDQQSSDEEQLLD
mmetsp:Transcript_28263/g.38885  ORF Transcript_28263/g.38885 Transcript_28263/m.38885 type:complete len:156 (+) Transcript_28263:236-703(+)